MIFLNIDLNQIDSSPFVRYGIPLLNIIIGLIPNFSDKFSMKVKEFDDEINSIKEELMENCYKKLKDIFTELQKNFSLDEVEINNENVYNYHNLLISTAQKFGKLHRSRNRYSRLQHLFFFPVILSIIMIILMLFSTTRLFGFISSIILLFFLITIIIIRYFFAVQLDNRRRKFKKKYQND